MDLKEISLDSVKGLISKDLYTILINNNFLTIGDVLNFPQDSFKTFNGVGYATHLAYTRFQSVINFTPDIIIKTYNKTLAPVIPETVKNVKIAYIGKLMHKQVLTLLLANGYVKIKDLDGLTVEKFQKFSYSGKTKAKRYAEFLAIVFYDPELILQATSKYAPIILPSKPLANDFFSTFSLFIIECYKVRFRNAVSSLNREGIETRKKIIINNYGLANHSIKAMCVEDVSKMCDKLDKERVRQIIREELNYFKELFSSGEDKLNNITVSESLLLFYRKLNDRLSRKVYAENLLYELFRNEYFDFKINSKENRYLMFWLQLLGFKLETSCEWLLRYESVFMRKMKHRALFKKRYFDLCLSVYWYLRKAVLSVNMNTLFAEMRKNFDCSLEDLLSVCDNCSFIESFSEDNSLKIQIPFHCLSSYVDMSYRLLKEGEAKPFSKDDLVILLSEKLNGNGSLVTEIKKIALSAQLRSSEKFASQGRKGWVLKEWGLNVDPVRCVMFKCFEIDKKPLSISELHDLVLNVYKRDDISIETLRMFLQRPHFFSIPCDGGLKYIAKEYAHNYSATIKKNSTVDWRLVLDILHENPNSNLNDLQTYCKRVNINVCYAHLFNYLSNSDYVKVDYVGRRRLYSVVSNYVELYDDVEQNRPKNKIKKFILESLDEKDVKLSLIDAVNLCNAKYGMSIASIYKLVSKMEDELLVLKKRIGRKIYLVKI